jgi:thiol-disulfide isomerase/thioredoxin
MKFRILLLILLSNAIILYAQQTTIEIGEKADFTRYNLTPIGSAKIATNKITIIDFWATWCGPCIAAFPELDSIQKKYQDKIQILALSTDPPEKVGKFLKNKSYSFSFFIDKDTSLFSLFRVKGVPLTCLFSSTGDFLWAGASKNLERVLTDHLNGKNIKPELSRKKDFTDEENVTESSNSIFIYSIARSNKAKEYSASVQHNIDLPINIKYVATPVSEVIQDLLGIPMLRFKNDKSALDTINIDLLAKSNSPAFTNKLVSKRILTDLADIFEFSIFEELREVTVYNISVTNRTKLNNYKEFIEGGGMVKKENDKVVFTMLDLYQLASYLEKNFKAFIVYEGDETTKYTFTLNKFTTIENLEAELTEKLGLTLKKTVKKLSFVEIK